MSDVTSGGGAPAAPQEASMIVPSTRDLLQVIGTRRRSVALIGLLPGEDAGEEAARLAELGVSALAFPAAGPAMERGAQATQRVPALCLAEVGDREATLAARRHGADGVCVDALLPADEWDRLAKGARTMRMLALALVRDEAGVRAAMQAGARAILVRADRVEAAREVARAAPRGMIVVAEVAGADADGLRALLGHVDAAVVPAEVHGARGFADLAAELDP